MLRKKTRKEIRTSGMGTNGAHYGRQLARAPLSIPACRPQNALYTPRSPRPSRPRPSSSPPVARGKTRFGRRSLFYAKSDRARHYLHGWVGGWGSSGRELGGCNVGELEGDVEEEEDAWRADIEQELQTLTAVQVQEGLGADNPFLISQQHIILDRSYALLDDFASRLRSK